ncbi:MAG: hypothetical protein ABIO82_00735 [Ginsengibacter sp.]
MVVAYCFTKFFQFRLPSPTIFKAVQMDSHSIFIECFNLVKKIIDSTKVWRVGYIVTNNMENARIYLRFFFGLFE